MGVQQGSQAGKDNAPRRKRTLVRYLSVADVSPQNMCWSGITNTEGKGSKIQYAAALSLDKETKAAVQGYNDIQDLRPKISGKNEQLIHEPNVQ